MTVQLQLALAKNGGVKLKEVKDEDDSCTVTLTRDDETVTCKYTKDDAVKAGLVRQGGAWDKYQRQMLRWRATGDALRMIAPDLVMGLLSPEEAQSIEPHVKPKAVTVEEIRQAFPDAVEVPVENEANPPADSPVESPPHETTPEAGPPKLTAKRLEFYREMDELKEKLGEDEYRNILSVYGKAKKSEITTLGAARKIKQAMENRLKFLQENDVENIG